MTYHVTIEGISPYMQHRMDDTKLEIWEKNRKQIIERPELNHEDVVRAEYHCYRNKEGSCYMPSEAIRIALIAGGTYLKGKVGTRSKSMKSIFAAVLQISPEEILLPDWNEIDKRSAVNKNVKARVMVIRPKWTLPWDMTFDMIIDNDSITIETLKELLTVTGSYVGIGSYRPTNSGYFGRFKLKEISLVKENK